MKKALLSFLTVLVAVLVLVGCGSEPVTKITITGETSVTKGETITLTVAVEPADADNAVDWTSSDTSVATVANGVVTGVELGNATITATAKDGSGVKGEIEIAVTPDVSMYYHTYESKDLGTINYWDSKESTVGDLVGYILNGYWGTRMNETKDGYEWYNILANEKPVGLDADGKALATNELTTTYKFEVKVGEEMVYNTLSKKPTFAAYKGREVALEDYLTPWKELYNQSNALARGAEGLTGAGSIKGLYNYYYATETGFNQTAWDNVGIKTSVEGGKSYMTFEFNVPCNAFYAMYYLASMLYTPIPASFLEEIGGLKSFGTWNSDKTLSPIDTSLSTGYYVVESWQTGKEIAFKKNDLVEDEGLYAVQGIYFEVLEAINEDSEAAFKEFLANKLDAAGIPSTQLSQYKNDDRATQTLDSSTYKLNMNTCTRDEWVALFGVEGSITQTEESDYWNVKPWMSNEDFLRGLSYSLNRKEIADTLGRSVSGNYFGSAYLSDPENGVSYNSTEEHKLATEQILANTDGYGYNLALAQAHFKAACEKLIADGICKSGDEIHIEIAWQTSAQVDDTGLIIASYMEKAFNECGGGLTLKVDHYFGAIWSDVYYQKMMVGQFDLGFGSVSGNSLNPINFLEVLRSDNTSGFTLNWGTDTSKVSDELEYDGLKWSFNALWQAADQGALVAGGELVDAYQIILSSSEQNSDGSRTVKFSYALQNTEGCELEISDVVLCNYQRYYYGDKEYEEQSVDFVLEDGYIVATIPADVESDWKGYLGFDIYLNQTIAGTESEVYQSFYTCNYVFDSQTGAVSEEVYKLEDNGTKASVAEGGKVYSYVAATYAERTKILGLLEKYAVENYLTGLVMYGDGGFVMYQPRLVPGSGSWDNYIPGYGFGTIAEGSIKGLLGE